MPANLADYPLNDGNTLPLIGFGTARLTGDDGIDAINSALTLGVTPGQVVLRWPLQLGALPLPESATPARQRENLDMYGFALTEPEVEAITALARPDGRLFDGDPDTPRRCDLSGSSAIQRHPGERRQLARDVRTGWLKSNLAHAFLGPGIEPHSQLIVGADRRHGRR